MRPCPCHPYVDNPGLKMKKITDPLFGMTQWPDQVAKHIPGQGDLLISEYKVRISEKLGSGGFINCYFMNYFLHTKIV